MGTLLDGKAVADKIALEVFKEAVKLKTVGVNPKIKFVRVGQREDDLSYERAAIKKLDRCNIDYEVLEFPQDISQKILIESLEEVSKDTFIHGILLFRPLPKHIDEKAVKHTINPKKDVDCFHPMNVAKIIENDDTGYLPCTPKAAIEILKYYNIDLKGKNAVIVGRSLVVGKPLSLMLLNEDATVTICHSKTENLAQVTKTADILVTAIGKSRMINEDYIKDGAIIIDVGINVDENGNMTGDVDTERCLPKVKYITPVPAGVGSVTTSILAQNLIKAAKLLTINK